MLPAPVVQKIGRFFVVRDDYLPGGSKMRYMLPYIEKLPHNEIIYASPAYGYAQMALAKVCAMLGKKAVVFVAKRKDPHPRTLKAKEFGATVYQVPHGYLNVVQARAKQYAADKGGFLVPFGVDVPEALDHFAAAARTIDIDPAEVWACSGSGALIRGLQKAWPGADFHSVRVGSEPKVGKARIWVAPEKYEQDAKMPPPFPSCGNYDAKVWQFVKRHGKDGALIWNVGA